VKVGDFTLKSNENPIARDAENRADVWRITEGKRNLSFAVF
jgi:hypothetical protein